MNRLLLLSISALAAGVGWFAGKLTSAPALPNPGAKNEPHPTRAEGQSRPINGTPILSEKIDAILTRATERYSISEVIPDTFHLAASLRSEEFPAAIASARSSAQSFGSTVAVLLAGYWAEVDLSSARDWMLKLTPGEQEPYAGEIAAIWGQVKPLELLDWFEALPPEEKTRMGSQVTPVIGSWVSRSEPERAVKLLFSLRPRSTNYFSSSQMKDTDPMALDISNAFSNWAAVAPQRAAEYALALPPSGARTAAVEGTVSAWASRDPAAARLWVEAISDAVVVANALPAFAIGAAQKDPRQAAEYIGGLPASEANKKAMSRVAELWATKDLNGALAWVRQLPDDDARRSIFGSMVNAILKMDVTKAATIVEKEDGSLLTQELAWEVSQSLASSQGSAAGFEFAEKLPESLRSGARESVLGTWAYQSPDEVQAWALALPEGELRGSSLRNLTAVHVNRDPTNVAKWIAKLPPGDSRDTAISGALSYFWHLGWDQTAELTALSSDRATARENLVRELRAFTSHGDQRTRQWVEKTAMLSPQEKAEALAPPQEN